MFSPWKNNFQLSAYTIIITLLLFLKHYTRKLNSPNFNLLTNKNFANEWENGKIVLS